jgi:predicted N-acyltransferase
MRYMNQLEPDALVDAFLQHPPRDFIAWSLADGTPVFSAEFNLLTTLEPDVCRTITNLPLYKWWGEWLKPYTCFVGTTVAEYVLAPSVISAEVWISAIKQALAEKYSFLIIKDIPQLSPLLTAEENRKAEAAIIAAQRAGFVMVEGQALAWVAVDFATVDDYLTRLSSVTRKSLRRKLKARENLAISTLATGDQFFSDEAVVAEFYKLYLNVFEQSDIHFDILAPEFFKSVLQSNQGGGVVMLYRHAGQLIGYNICFVSGNKLVDKYVGFVYPAARDHNLYFVSWFVNLQYALDHKLACYVAGWTDPDVKKSLGAHFTFTSHAVHVRNPLLRNILRPFKSWFERDSKVIERATRAETHD